jgi:hypothetical protein
MMKIESLKNKTEPLTRILFAVAVLLGALVFLKIGFFVSSSNAMLMAAQTDPNQAGATDLKKVLAATKASADQIKKNNLFMPGSVKQYPVNEVIGILGQEALIGDKWYKVGDSVGEAKIVAIEPTKVKVVWNGQEKEFSPIGSSGNAGGRGERAGPPGRASGPGAGQGRSGSAMAAGASPEDREKLRQQFMNASPEEKQRLREQMRGNRGGRGR